MSCAFRGRGLLSALAGHAFAVPTQVTGTLFVPLLGPRSLLGSRLEDGDRRGAGDTPALAPSPLRVIEPLVETTAEPVPSEPAPAAEEAARHQGRERKR